MSQFVGMRADFAQTVPQGGPLPASSNILHCETTEMAPGDGVNLVAINADNEGKASHVLTSLAGRTHHPDNR